MPKNLKPIISLKLRETEPYNRKTLVLKGLTLLNTTTRGMQWDLYILHNDSGLTTGKSFQNVTKTSYHQFKCDYFNIYNKYVIIINF